LRIRIVAAIGAVLAAAWLAPAVAGGLGVPIGMNFNFLDPDLSALANCIGRPGATTRDRGRLAHYGDPAVQRRSESDLARLVGAGASWIRTLVWLQPGPAPSNVFSMPGDLDRARRNVVALAGDLQRSGVANWVLAFGFQGRARPNCRAQGRMGGCFDPASVSATVAEVIAIRRALEGVPRPPNLWIDLHNEGCSPPPVLQSQQALDVPLISAYLRAFPQDRVTISCIGDNAITARFAALGQTFALAGARPSFYDAHIYARAGLDPVGNAATYAGILRSAGAEGIIGETNLNDPTLAAALIGAMRAHAATPAALIFWPKTDRGSPCSADVPEILPAPVAR